MKKEKLNFLSIITILGLAVCFFIFTSCEKDIIGSEMPVDSTFTVIFDDFEIHKDYEDYTNVTTAGHGLIDYLAYDGYIDYPSGSGWYAYASDNGARVYVYDDNSLPDYLIDSSGTEADADDVMEKMQGNGSLTVVFDCRDSLVDLTGSLDYYYAGIGVPIGGVVDSLGSLKDSVTIYGDNVYWDFSGLKSVSIKGSIQGSVIMFFEYKVDTTDAAFEDGIWGYHALHIEGNVDSPKDIDNTYEISMFKPVKGTPIETYGKSWDTVKNAVSSFVIELDTEAASGGDFSIIKLDDLKFNFESEEDGKKAFPWID